MTEPPSPLDPSQLWRQQPEESSAIVPPGALARRTVALHASSRSEVLGSLCAATLFVLVIGWRLAASRDALLWLALTAIALWVVLTAWRSRRQIRTIQAAGTPGGDARAASGLDYYYEELLRRQAHLRSGWLWHGPLILSCATLGVVLLQSRGITWTRLAGVVPLLIVLVAWVAIRNLSRWREVRQVRREIEEVQALRSANDSGPGGAA